jgi:hypothetical protein
MNFFTTYIHYFEKLRIENDPFTYVRASMYVDMQFWKRKKTTQMHFTILGKLYILYKINWV